jgi:hypothetical protein
VCGVRMQYDDVKEFAPREVFRRYVYLLLYLSEG